MVQLQVVYLLFTSFFVLCIYLGVHVSEVTRKGNSDVRVGERLHTYIYLYLPVSSPRLVFHGTT